MAAISRSVRYIAWASVALICIPLASCQKRERISIGFLAGLSGKAADLGGAGRNGALLAIEQCNAAGGIDGRQVDLIVRDVGPSADSAGQAIAELIDQQIELVIGPMTSSVAMSVMPQINGSKTILLSPTVTTTELGGRDDNFLRVIAMTSDYATKCARYQYEKLGTHTVAAVYDIGNRAYTESWLENFKAEFTRLGGTMVLARGFLSSETSRFADMTMELLAAKPDAILIISNAVDSAILCQKIRETAPKQRIVMSEWASTERFIELAGTASEGVVVAQFLDRNDPSERYRRFMTAYRERFKQEPGFAGVAGYDAALVAIDAYGSRRNNEPLKKVILEKANFQGVQQQLHIDRYGDADRRTCVTIVRDGQYVTVE